MHTKNILPPTATAILSSLASELSRLMPVMQEFIIVPRSYGLDLSRPGQKMSEQIIVNPSCNRHDEISFYGLALVLPATLIDKTLRFIVYPNTYRDGKYDFIEVNPRLERQLIIDRPISAAVKVILLPKNNFAVYGIAANSIGKSVCDYSCKFSGTILYQPEKDTEASIEDHLTALLPSELRINFLARGSANDTSALLKEAVRLAKAQASLYSSKTKK